MSAEPASVTEAHGAHQTSTGIDTRKLAMWAFLASDCLLFGALIATYMLYRNTDGGAGLLPVDVYDIPFTSISSFVLLMSSLTMVLAVHAAMRDDDHAMRTWLVATAFLGTIFIAGQTYEFTAFVNEGLTVSLNPAASAFYVLTSFHGIHVTFGIVMLLTLVGISARGRLTREKGLTVELVGLYWHFVDIVWILLFAIVYLIPH